MSSKTRIRSALLLVVLLALPMALPPAEAAYREIRVDEDEVTSRTVTLIAPAVAELSDGSLLGVGMEMEATVRDGSGGVYVDTRPLTQIDMQGSARLAATMAASLSGADLREYDFFVTMRSPAPAVGGPSAGAAMTVAFTALLLDLPVRDDVVMTGMINPDGSVGPVGGILEKAQAAHDHGAELFLVPEGQSVVRRLVREQVQDGWLPRETVREEQVDVRAYAEDRWGLEVREVTDVHEAVRFATDHRIERPEAPTEPGPPLFDDVMAAASRAQVDEANEESARLRAAMADPASADAETLDGLEAALDQADALLERADAATANGSYYTASSRAFQALVTLRTVDLWLRVLEAEDDRAFLQREGDRAAGRLDNVTTRAGAMDPETVSSLEAVGAAQVRVMEADRLIGQAAQALAEDRLAAAVEALGFGIQRTASVTWWLDIADELSAQGEGVRLQAAPRDLASDYTGIAQQAVVYAEVLLAQTGSGGTTGRLLQEAAQALGSAQEAQQRGLDVGALYLAMEAQVTAHAALSLVGGTDLLEDRLSRQRDRALIQVAQTRELGAEPFLAVSYLEFAESLSADQPVEALLMYGNAGTIAATSGALATGRICGFGVASCGTERPAVTRVGVPGPDPWTAYLALATVLLGFMAGVLVALLVLQARDRRIEGPTGPARRSGSAARSGSSASPAAATRPAGMRRPRPAVPAHGWNRSSAAAPTRSVQVSGRRRRRPVLTSVNAK